MSASEPSGEHRARLPGLGLRADERLAQRAAAGDERAFASIFRRYEQEIYRYCLSMIGNQADAQDALQNTMVKALRSLPGEQRQIKLRPWLYRVAHNESVELLRQRRHELLDPEAAGPAAGPAETAEQRRRLRHLLADIAELPDRQRASLTMRELGGLGFEEIGAALGTSAAVARQTVYEARLGLREMETGREMECETITRAISDGDGRVLRRRDVRSHLRSCAECRAFADAIEARRHDFAAIAPLPAVAAAALLKGAFGAAGGGGAVAGGAAATGGGAAGAGGALASGLVVKVVATVAVGAAIGAGVADRTGLVQIGGSGGAQPAGSGHGGANGGGDGTAGASRLGAGAAAPALAAPGGGNAVDAARRKADAAVGAVIGAPPGRARGEAASGSAPTAQHGGSGSPHGNPHGGNRGKSASAGNGQAGQPTPTKGGRHAAQHGAGGKGTRGKGGSKASPGSQPDHGSHGKAAAGGSPKANDGGAGTGAKGGGGHGAASSPAAGKAETGPPQPGGEQSHGGSAAAHGGSAAASDEGEAATAEGEIETGSP